MGSHNIESILDNDGANEPKNGLNCAGYNKRTRFLEYLGYDKRTRFLEYLGYRSRPRWTHITTTRFLEYLGYGSGVASLTTVGAAIAYNPSSPILVGLAVSLGAIAYSSLVGAAMLEQL